MILVWLAGCAAAAAALIGLLTLWSDHRSKRYCCPDEEAGEALRSAKEATDKVDAFMKQIGVGG